MSQFEMPTINPTTYSGTDLAADLNAWSDSVLSGNSGTSRPSYAVAGTPWYNTSTSKLKLYDGSVDFTIPYGNVTTYGTSLIESADATAARTLLACAPLASPAFTGTPTAPTQTAGDNSTKLATTAYVDNAATPSVDVSQWPTISNNVTDSEHDIDFSAGKILDSTGTDVITSTAITKQIDAAWAAGDNAGGLFSGIVTSGETYNCFLIVKDSDGSIDAGFDTDENAANIPSGYTTFRRIGKVVTDSSSNIIQFTQYNDYFMLDSQILDADLGTLSTSRTTITASNPKGTVGIFGLDLNYSGSSQVLFTSIDQSDTSPSTTNCTIRVTSDGELQCTEVRIYVSNAGNIYYRASGAAIDALRVYSRGWIDQRNT